MKKVFLASASIAATLLGVQANAATGYIGAGYVRGNVDAGGSDVDTDSWGVSGAAAFDLGGSLGLQAGASLFQDDDGVDNDTAMGADLHVFTRNESSLVGGFVAITDQADTTVWTAGADVNGYMENVTFAGQLGYSDLGDLDASALSATGELRFFMHPNLRIDAGVGYFNLNADSGVDSDGYSYGLGGEWQLPNAPISVFAGWNQAHANDVSVTVNAATVGVRYNISGTLKDRDRTGAGLGSGLASGLSKLF